MARGPYRTTSCSIVHRSDLAGGVMILERVGAMDSSCGVSLATGTPVPANQYRIARTSTCRHCRQQIAHYEGRTLWFHLNSACNMFCSSHHRAEPTERRWFEELGVRLGIALIRFSERHKDRELARELHDIADQYDPRPTGQWATDDLSVCTRDDTEDLSEKEG